MRDARDARARAPLHRVPERERAARARDADVRRPPPPPPRQIRRDALLKAVKTAAAEDGVAIDKTEDVRRYISMGVDVDWQNPDVSGFDMGGDVSVCSKALFPATHRSTPPTRDREREKTDLR